MEAGWDKSCIIGNQDTVDLETNKSANLAHIWAYALLTHSQIIVNGVLFFLDSFSRAGMLKVPEEPLMTQERKAESSCMSANKSLKDAVVFSPIGFRTLGVYLLYVFFKICFYWLNRGEVPTNSTARPKCGANKAMVQVRDH
jgi:hypothetical protein